jgi:hypothetical protein
LRVRGIGVSKLRIGVKKSLNYRCVYLNRYNRKPLPIEPCSLRECEWKLIRVEN